MKMMMKPSPPPLPHILLSQQQQQVQLLLLLLLLLVLFFSSSLITFVVSDSNPYVWVVCSSPNSVFAPNGTFQANLAAALSALPAAAAAAGGAARCPNSKAAAVWYDKSFLRYSAANFSDHQVRAAVRGFDGRVSEAGGLPVKSNVCTR